MIGIPKIQIDPNRESIGLSELYTRKEFLIFFFLLPIIISTIGGILGVYLTEEGIVAWSEEGIELLGWLLLGVGYLNCVIFAILSVKVLITDKESRVIKNPHIITLALGINFFLAYFFSVINLRFIIGYDDSLVTYTGNQFLAWITGGFLVIHIVLNSQIDFQPSTKDRIPDLSPKQLEGAIDKKSVLERVSFREAVNRLDSEKHPRRTRMNIEFICEAAEGVSPEKNTPPGIYRTLLVKDPNSQLLRKLHVWGSEINRNNIDITTKITKGDQIRVIKPLKPKYNPRYYQDEQGKDVFWISETESGIVLEREKRTPLEDKSYFYDSAIYKTKRGHKVRSKNELIIDNFLFSLGIEYEYEKSVVLAGREYRPDWFLPDLNMYIECWGMEGKEDYDERQRQKMKNYLEHGLKVLNLNEEDIKEGKYEERIRRFV